MLNENQMKCIKLMVSESKTQKQIAQMINVTEKTICEWKKDKEFKEVLQTELRENFGSLAVEAQKQLEKLLKSKNEYIKMQAIKDILDRAGYKPTDKVEQTNKGDVNVVFNIPRPLKGDENGNSN